MIRPTFLAFETAKQALNVSQAGLDTVGHNISNANTPGYTRQRVDQVSISMNGASSKYQSFGAPTVGLGAQVSSVSQIRDPFLDNRYRAEATRNSELAVKADGLLDINNIFDEIMTDGLHSKISDLLTAIDKFSWSADSESLAMVLKNTASELAGMINSNYRLLEEALVQQKSDFSVTVEEDVNNIIEKIAYLNQKIKDDNFYGNPSNELNDERNMLIDKLSEYVDIKVVRTPVKISNDLTIESVSIELKDSGDATKNVPNVLLVDGGNFNKFKVSETDNGNVKISVVDGISGYELDIDGDYNNGVNSDVTTKLLSGGLKGYIDIINGAGPNAGAGVSTFRGIPYYMASLDEFAQNIAEVFNRVNNISEQESADSGKSYTPVLSGTASDWMKEIASGTIDFSGKNTNISFEYFSAGNNITATIMDADGVPRSYSSAYNQNGTIDFMDLDDPTKIAFSITTYDEVPPTPTLEEPTTSIVVDAGWPPIPSTNGDKNLFVPLSPTLDPKPSWIDTFSSGTKQFSGANYDMTFEYTAPDQFKATTGGKDYTGTLVAGEIKFFDENNTIAFTVKTTGETPPATTTTTIDANITAKNISISSSWNDDPMYITTTKMTAVTEAKASLALTGSNNPAWLRSVEIVDPSVKVRDGSYTFDIDNATPPNISVKIDGITYTGEYKKDGSIDLIGGVDNKVGLRIVTTTKDLGRTDATNTMTVRNISGAAADNLNKLTIAMKDSNAYSNSGFYGNFQMFLEAFQSEMALDKGINESNLAASTTVISAYADRRDAISAVSVDEEGINMMTYQNYYNAAARYMTTLDEALDKIINGMGTVGR